MNSDEDAELKHAFSPPKGAPLGRCTVCGKNWDHYFHETSEAGESMSDCPFCGHVRHDGVFCKGRSDCDCDTDHACACSFPDPENYAEVPE